MGCGGSLPKEEDLKAQSPADSPCATAEYPAAGNVQKFCIISGEDVRQPKEDKESEERVVMKLYCINRSDGKRCQTDQGLTTITTFPGKKLLGAIDCKDLQAGDTIIYSVNPIVAGTAAVEVQIMEEIEKAPLYPFCKVSGGRLAGKQSKPFTISKFTGGDNYELLYNAANLGGSFWKIEKSSGDLAGIVVPARMHFKFICDGATACVTASGVDPFMILLPMIVKNCNILGPTFKMPGQ